MEKRRLGQSDLYVSKMGLGCMSLGTDFSKAERIIETALDAGINYFDTADLYDYGVNEEIIGKVLASKREQVIIATKVGNQWKEDKSGWIWNPSKEYIKEAVKKSLHRLNTDYIDLYQLHGGTIEDPIDEIIEAFEELKEEGIIRYYGLSSIRPNVIKQYAEKSSIVSNMMQYSLLDRRPEEMMPLLQTKNISIVTRGSLAKGLLTESIFRKDLNQLPNYLDYTTSEIKELLHTIKSKITERTLTEIALQFILAHESVSSVVLGASSEEQVRENAASVERPPLEKEELEFLKNITKASQYTEHRF